MERTIGRQPRIRLDVEVFYPPPRDICLCLSGGGFRAAAYHLGVVQWLFEEGVLPYVQEFRSVSGGSLIAAWLWRNSEWILKPSTTEEEFESRFTAPFLEFISSDIRTGPFLRTAGVNLFSKEPRVRQMERRVAAFLRVAELSDPPQTDALFRFLALNTQTLELDGLRPTLDLVARQLLASAAFPPVVGPVRIGSQTYLDGGLASNLGIGGDTLHKWRMVMVSDAGKGLPNWLSSARTPVSLRVLKILRGGADSAVRSFLAQANSDEVIVAVAPLPYDDWFSDTSGEHPSSDLTRLGRLRTDLAGFSRRDLEALQRAGYLVARNTLGRALDSWAARAGVEESRFIPDQTGVAAYLERRSSAYDL